MIPHSNRIALILDIVQLTVARGEFVAALRWLDYTKGFRASPTGIGGAELAVGLSGLMVAVEIENLPGIRKRLVFCRAILSGSIAATLPPRRKHLTGGMAA